MKNLLKKLTGRKEDRYRRKIKEIRKSNPTCIIKNGVSISSTGLGMYVSLLEGSSLRDTEIDNYSYVGKNSNLNNVSIGKFCSIGPDIKIGLASHPLLNNVTTYPAFYSPENEGCAVDLGTARKYTDDIKKTVIGNDVWIGANVIIPGGITIGTGSVIAAGSVVTRDVEAYSIVGGNPAGLIRKRFSQEKIAALLESEWWEWPLEKIRENIDKFSHIEDFCIYLEEKN